MELKFKNNPLNIRYNARNRWQGMIEPLRGFCQFVNTDFCLRAGYIILRTYYRNGVSTYGEILNRYAPSSENDTDAYLAFIMNKCRCFPFDVVDSHSKRCELLKWMCVYETGFYISQIVVEHIIESFKLKFV